MRGVLILRLLSGFRVGYWCWTGVWQKLLVPCSHLPAVFLGTFPWTRRVFFFTCGSSAFGEFGRGAQLFMCGAQFAVSLHYGVLHHGCRSALFKCKKKQLTRTSALSLCRAESVLTSFSFCSCSVTPTATACREPHGTTFQTCRHFGEIFVVRHRNSCHYSVCPSQARFGHRSS